MVIELSKNEKEKIIEYMADALAQIPDQTDAIKILSDIYCNNMPYASEKLGKAVAKEVVNIMSDFYQNCEHSDRTDYIKAKVSESVRVLPNERTAEFLENAIHLFDNFGSLLKDNQTENIEIVQTSQQTSELLTQTTEAIIEQQDRISLAELKKFYAGYNSETSYLQQLHGEDMETAVLAVVIYTMAKNGELTGLPSEITLRQVVTIVCADSEFHKTIRFYNEGDITEQKAESSKRKIIKGFLLSLFSISLLSVLPGTVLITGFVSSVVLGCRCLTKVGKVRSQCNNTANIMLEENAEDINPVNLKLVTKRLYDVYPTAEDKIQIVEDTESDKEEVENLQTEKARERH